MARPAGERQRPARRHDVQAALGIEHVGETEQIVLVGAAAVVQDHQPLGVAGRGALSELECAHAPHDVVTCNHLRETSLHARGRRGRSTPACASGTCTCGPRISTGSRAFYVDVLGFDVVVRGARRPRLGHDRRHPLPLRRRLSPPPRLQHLEVGRRAAAARRRDRAAPRRAQLPDARGARRRRRAAARGRLAAAPARRPRHAPGRLHQRSRRQRPRAGVGPAGRGVAARRRGPHRDGDRRRVRRRGAGRRGRANNHANRRP